MFLQHSRIFLALVTLYSNNGNMLNINGLQIQPRLQQLANTEIHLLKTLESKIYHHSNLYPVVQKKLQELISCSSTSQKKEEYLNNALNAMTLVRRLAEDWTSLSAMAGGLNFFSISKLDNTRMPISHHVDYISRGLARTQTTYNLSTESLVQGFVAGTRVTSDISAADCVSVAKAFFSMFMIPEATEWFEQALQKIKNGDKSVLLQTVLQYLPVCFCASGEYSRAKSALGMLLQEQQLEIQTDLLNAYVETATADCADLSESIQPMKYETDNAVGEVHERLCQGHGQLQSGLRCRYIHYQRPHLMIQPFKMEELHRDPPVVMFHDAISDSESDRLKQESLNRMELAETTNRESTENVTSFYRTSQVAWFKVNETKDTYKRSYRVADMTQMDRTAVQPDQVSRYGVAGEFMPHIDFVGGNYPWITDRIATLMFYLNDVEAGGNTVFLNLNLTIKPVKNSAILWFSLLPNGDRDPLSLHSGCPVLKGTKWILNKWFLNNGNTFRLPCGLRTDASFEKYYILKN